jgi:hypothetical protein
VDRERIQQRRRLLLSSATLRASSPPAAASTTGAPSEWGPAVRAAALRVGRPVRLASPAEAAEPAARRAAAEPARTRPTPARRPAMSAARRWRSVFARRAAGALPERAPAAAPADKGKPVGREAAPAVRVKAGCARGRPSKEPAVTAWSVATPRWRRRGRRRYRRLATAPPPVPGDEGSRDPGLETGRGPAAEVVRRPVLCCIVAQ